MVGEADFSKSGEFRLAQIVGMDQCAQSRTQIGRVDIKPLPRRSSGLTVAKNEDWENRATSRDADRALLSWAIAAKPLLRLTGSHTIVCIAERGETLSSKQLFCFFLR